MPANRAHGALLQVESGVLSTPTDTGPAVESRINPLLQKTPKEKARHRARFFHAVETQISTCVPSSITRFSGRLK